MKITKAIVLAGVTALSVGIGTAMAQSEVPTATSSEYLMSQANSMTPAEAYGSVQSGSADVGTIGYGPSSAVPFNGDFSTLANPG